MRPRSRPITVGPLFSLAAGLGAAVAALVSRAVAIWPQAHSPAARVEDWVELGVLAAAAIAATWVGVSALLGLAVVVCSRAGARWHAGEAVVRCMAPGVVRRLVRVGAGVGVGASLALTPAAAFAATAPPDPIAAVAQGDAIHEGGVDEGARFPDGAGPSALGAGGAGRDSGAGAILTVGANASGGLDLAWRSTAALSPTVAQSPTADRSAASDLTPSAGPSPAANPAPASAGAATPGSSGTPAGSATTPSASAAASTQAPTSAPTPSHASTGAGTSGSATADAATAGASRTPQTPGTSAPTEEISPVIVTPAPTSRGAETVVVARGDTLWDIAARDLGGRPTDGEILAAMLAWHQANRAVIGDDPDLILPGQILVRPT
ncbi:LysM peptidoglycan-binding domain-containing protein [Xylanimonas ulmi]|uniref:Nucleoid-associated protein YgaU n=1 Tax=Xylanimonas ulmi TaxID=228973 RepID=A0A4Q7M103_9MICO|nr:LysM domain-containing protein [Xylanibacterium ulmi]RZS60038.1 nucleoid-associated protein YgaU [Xylanibacterium ulmi]